MLTIFLGAGFSKWAADIPVASQLFDFNIENWGPRESNKLRIVKTLKWGQRPFLDCPIYWARNTCKLLIIN